MTCSSCVSNIKDNLNKVKGFNNIEIYLEDGKAFLEYDDDTTCDAIVEKINELGFECFELDKNSDHATGDGKFCTFHFVYSHFVAFVRHLCIII